MVYSKIENFFWKPEMFRIVGLFHLLGCLLNKSEKSEMIQISPKRFFGIPAFYSEVYLFTDSLLLNRNILDQPDRTIKHSIQTVFQNMKPNKKA